MTFHAPADLLRASFRASPYYRIVPFEQLTARQQQLLDTLRRHPGASAMLLPAPGSGRTVRSVSRETADLLRGYANAAPLPDGVTAALGESAERAILRLVLDDVLEIEDGGCFLSGVAAAQLLLGATPAPLPAGHIGALSLEALRHAAALDDDDSRSLAARLYRFNTRPLSPRWLARLPTTQAIGDFLGLDGAGGHRTATAPGIEPFTNEGWLIWAAPGAAPNAGATTFKLYVSPPAELLRDALPAVLALLGSDGRAIAVKVGAELAGLLRPDKLVAYFDTEADLHRAAELVQRRLGGMPAHGVPFTAELAGNGLLSWGVDPPGEHALLAWQGSSSWRTWLANRLAASLVAARTATESMPSWRFALERLRLDGVDTATFAPQGGAWPGGES